MVRSFRLASIRVFVNQWINHTSNPKAYYFRLLTFAFLSQVPYSIFVIINNYSNNLNILFLFVCAYPVIHFFKHRAWLEFTVCGLIAYFFSQHCDAGLYGLGLLLSIYLFSELDTGLNELIAWLLWLLVILYGYVTIAYYQAIVFPLPILFLSFKKMSLGQKSRWFYWFYPLHFIPLIALKYVTSR